VAVIEAGQRLATVYCIHGAIAEFVAARSGCNTLMRR